MTMDETTKAALIAELAEICRKYNVVIGSNADAADDEGLESWIEIEVAAKEWSERLLVFRCAEINQLGVHSKRS